MGELFGTADSIRIDKIRVAGKHGVSAAERESCLPLEISVALLVDLSKAQKTDDLEDTVNYSTIRRQVVDVVEKTSFKLLEGLATAIFQELWKNPRIQQAQVRIAKPERLDGATPSVSMLRRNPQYVAG